MYLELSIIIAQIVAFLIMLWILKLFAWKPFKKLLAERQSKIESEFQAIDLQKLELQKLTDEYQERLANIDQEAKKTLHRALEEADNVSKQISHEAHLKAKIILENGKKAIDQEVAQARTHLKETLVTLVMRATEKLIEEKIDREKEGNKIAEFVNHLEIK